MPALTKASLDLPNQLESPSDRKPEEEFLFEHKYSQECERMLSRFIESLDSSLESDESLKVLHHTEEPFIQISQDPKVSYGYKIVARLDCTSELAFEYMLNVDRWKQWDVVCDNAEIVETVDPVTRFQYIRTKPIWPVSARDVLLFSTMKKLEDGKYVMVGKSMDHEKCPTKKGVLRMDVNFLGMCVFAEPEDNTKCRVVLVADGDPKGWVPKNIVKFVATNAIPMSLRILSENLGTLSPIEYNLIPILNSLADVKPLARSSLLSSLRSSILRLSMKSPNNAKSRVSIISSFLLSKGDSYYGSYSSPSIKSRSISSASSKFSKLTRSASSRLGSPMSIKSTLSGESTSANIVGPAHESPVILSSSESHVSTVHVPPLTDTYPLDNKSKSFNPSDSDMTTTVAPSTISINTNIDSNAKRRHSILEQPKQVTEKIYGKLRRMKTRVRNAMGISTAHSKVSHQEEFNEKTLNQTPVRYHNNSSPGLKVTCLT